jgi:hypothetical protein
MKQQTNNFLRLIKETENYDSQMYFTGTPKTKTKTNKNQKQKIVCFFDQP